MKNLKNTAMLAIGIALLASCSVTSHVVDDDVYVSKNPQMSSTEEVNDVSSYENYRYRRDRGDSETRYARDNRLFRTNVFLISTMNQPFYNPYYNPYYGHNYYSGFYSPFHDPFNPFNSMGYADYWAYGMGGYGYAPYGYYGYPYGYTGYNYYGYGNPYWNNNYYNPNPIGGNVSQNYNTHYGPRHSISGVNNNRRGQSPEAKGLAVQNNGSRNFKAAGSNTEAGKTTRNREITSGSGTSASGRGTGVASRTSEAKNSRSVTSGTGLSRNGNTVSTHNNTQRGTYNGGNTGRGSVDVNRSNSDYNKPSRTFESGNSGTTRNSGGNTTTSPRSNGGASGGSGGATINRRGGR